METIIGNVVRFDYKGESRVVLVKEEKVCKNGVNILLGFDEKAMEYRSFDKSKIENFALLRS